MQLQIARKEATALQTPPNMGRTWTAMVANAAKRGAKI